MIISRGRTVFVGDVAVTERPDGEEMADIAIAMRPKPDKWAIFHGWPSCHLLILAIQSHAPASKQDGL